MADEIVLVVTNTSTFIKGSLESEYYHALKKELGYLPENAIFALQHNQQDPSKQWSKDWDGRITTVCYNKSKCRCPVKKDGTHFPTGLLSKATAFFKQAHISYKIYDKRDSVEKSLSLSIDTDQIEERDYQTKCVADCLKKERGLVKLATGGGKTLIGAKIISELSVSPFIFYVTSKDLMNQAKNELSRFILQNGKSLEVGVIGDGKCDIRDVNVMTVQTAIRACGAKYKKYDDEEEYAKEKEISDAKKKDILNLITSAKAMICDEVHHWRSNICQVISDYSLSCKYKYGFSATPKRDEGDDILIDACFGRQICDINASYLIAHKNKYLVKPDIYFVPVKNMRGKKFDTYATAYKEAIVENALRNDLITKIANKFTSQGRVILILCRQIAHGEILESLIPGSVFLHGSHGSKIRKEHLEKMRKREACVTISTSLPYSETLLIKESGFIKQVEIGELCESSRYKDLISKKDIMVLCSNDGKKYAWEPITNTHKHKKQNSLVRVVTNKNEDVIVTENHSLVDCDKKEVLPRIGDPVSVPFGKLEGGKINEKIDLLSLFKNINDNSLEIEIFGLTQGKIRTLKKQREYLINPKNVCKESRSKFKKELDKIDRISYKVALDELFANFKYYKYRYRAKLSEVCDCKQIFNFFEASIYIRRSRKNFSLPLSIPITESLAIISGLICSEGHVKYQTSPKAKSRYDFIFSALVGNMTDGKHDVDKRNIRHIFMSNFRQVFGDVDFIENEKQIRFNGKLIYRLFSEMGHIDASGDKKIPDYIYNSKKNIQEAFLWGFYLGDGSRKLDYRKGKKESNTYTAIDMCNSSRRLASGLCCLLRLMGLRYYISFGKSSKKTKRRYVISIIDKFWNLEQTKKVFKTYTSDQCERIQKEVERIDDNSEFVYDISVSNAENFVSGVGNVLCHNSIFDEGIDCKPLDTLILAGSGKSQTRALQRVGRILRPYPGKQDAIVVDFEDNCKYMYGHSNKRRKIYETEPEFNIETLNI